MVKIELDHLGVPYSWRFFDGEAPTVQYLIPDFAPEFTLREYKIVIIVVGGFFGTLPGILDKTALAQVALEQDGWKCALLYDADIRRNPRQALIEALPELNTPSIRGPERPNPIGAVEIMTARLAQLKSRGLNQKRFIRQERALSDRRDSVDSKRGAGRRRRRRTHHRGYRP